jgi:hypothetical protein
MLQGAREGCGGGDGGAAEESWVAAGGRGRAAWRLREL